MKLTPEQIKSIQEARERLIKAWKILKEAFTKAVKSIRRFWFEMRLSLLKTLEGRRILMEVITNNTWRRMHGLPMIRRF